MKSLSSYVLHGLVGVWVFIGVIVFLYWFCCSAPNWFQFVFGVSFFGVLFGVLAWLEDRYEK
jgi:hypothetical protein